MHIRLLEPADLPAAVELTVETFRPFFTEHVRAWYGEELFGLHHGRWQQDYHDLLPTLHDPATRRWVAVATDDSDEALAGLVAWNVDGDHGLISLLAVSPAHRREEIGRRLSRHALDAMAADGVRVVEVATGGDPWHAPARGLYESLGFLKVPIAGYIRTI